jgi:hypothetical protein
MSRPRLPTSALFPLRAVIGVCSVDPHVTDDLKGLIKPTGKRGRPVSKVDGKKVVALLKRKNAKCALKMFTEFAAKQA